MVHVLYLVHNLADPAVARRVAMMRDGGATVSVAGFIRRNSAIADEGLSNAIVLGETADGRFAQRLAVVVATLVTLPRLMSKLAVPDVIMARNLEMLAVADRLRSLWGRSHPVVYECLDIHRLLLRDDVIGQAMRSVERQLTKRAVLLVTSSPAFLRNYFDIHGAPRALLLENKVPFAGGGRGQNLARRQGVEAIRIGWFGALRCRRSLDALSQLAGHMDGRVEVVLRGRPALSEFDDFFGSVNGQANLQYVGPYRNPDDLLAIYSDVHFAWAIDLFEAGQNSEWLLPNRLYEGCLHGAIPIALQGTETARFIEARGLGIVVPDIELATLVKAIAEIEPQRLLQLADNVARADQTAFSFDKAAARQFVAELAQASSGVRSIPEVA